MARYAGYAGQLAIRNFRVAYTNTRTLRSEEHEVVYVASVSLVAVRHERLWDSRHYAH
jgi:hypothetical protein